MTAYSAIVLLIINLCHAVITGSLTPSNTNIQTTQSLSFELALSIPIPANGYIQLQFSSGFDLTQSPTIQCAQTYGMQSLSGCSVLSTSTLQINNAESQDYLVLFSVNNVVLPSYVNSFFVVATSFQASGVQLETSGSTAIKITTSPQLMTVTLTPSNQTVGARNNLEINTVTPIQVPQTGEISIDFPKWNSGTQTLGLESSMFEIQSLNYDSMTNSYQIPCQSTDHPNLKCNLFVGQATSVETISTTYDTLTFRFFSQSFTTLKVQILDNVFINPPSTRPITNIDASQSNSAGFLQQTAPTVAIQVTQPATLPGSQAQVQATIGSINVQDTYTFTMLVNLPLPVGAVIQITVPPQVSIYAFGSTTNQILNACNGYDPVYPVPQVKVIDAAKQIIVVNNLVPTSNYYVDAGNYVKFDLLYLTNPGSQKPTDPFNITFFDETNIIAIVRPGPTLTATPGKFQSNQVLPQSYKVRVESAYTFSFVTTNAITNSSQVKITVPTQITVIGTNLVVQGIMTLTPNSSPQVQYNSQTRTITLTNCFSQTYSQPVLVQFIVISGLSNPADTQPTQPFIIQTVDQFGSIIDSGPSNSLTFTANLIQSIKATACYNKQSISQTSDVCTYELLFQIGSQYPILADSSINITLPSDLRLFDTSLTAKNSSTTGIADFSSKFSVQSDLRTVIVSNAFLLSSAPNGQDYRQDSFAVNIAGIITPRSTAPTLSFQAKIISRDGYLEYQRLQGIYSSVYQARSFRMSVVMPNNQTNGAVTTYNFTLQLSSIVFKNEFIKITPPPEIRIIAGLRDQCIGVRLLATQLSCTVIQDSLYIMIIPQNATTSSFTPGAIIQFQVNNMVNPTSLSPTLSFQIYIATNTINNYFVNQIVQGLSIQNVLNGQLQNVQVLPDSSQFGASTNYSVYFTTANIIPQNGFIQVVLPQPYYQIPDNITCLPVQNLFKFSFCTLNGTNTIQLNNGFSQGLLARGQGVAFKIVGIVNPKQSVSAQVISKDFSITTYTQDSYSIDQTSNLNFTIGCNFPCNSCTQDQSVCTSCQSVNGKPLLLFQNSCSNQCPIGYYADANNVCKTCDYPCSQCNSRKDYCDSCLKSSGLPFAFNGSCYKDCPEGTYQNPLTLTCDQCVNNCKTCLNQNTCLSCKNPFYFLDNACLSSCPNTSVQFNSTQVNECQTCKPPCVTCNGTVDTCTSCQVGLFLFGSTCVEKCPTTYLPNDQNVCYLASQFRLPFIMISGTVVIAIVVIISNKKYPNVTKPLSAYLGLQITWMVLFWFWCFGWFVSDSYRASSTLQALALVANYIINYWWYEYYKSKIMQNDKLYRVYKDSNPKFQKTIVILSFFTSFQLFRISYCRLFDCQGFSASISGKEKYYKKMNRLTHFQITFVFMPTVIASIYNLFYTWYGRQCFWNDIENLVQSSQTLVLMTLVLFRSQIHYIGKITQEDEIDIGQKQPVETQQVKRIADSVTKSGFDINKKNLKDLTPETKMDVITGVFKRLIKNDKPYTTTHGQKNENFNAYFKKGTFLPPSPDKYAKMPELSNTQIDQNVTEMNFNLEDTQKLCLRLDEQPQSNRLLGPQVISGGKNQLFGDDERDGNLPLRGDRHLVSEPRNESQLITDQDNQLLSDTYQQIKMTKNGPSESEVYQKVDNHLDQDDKLFNFQSAPFNANSALQGNSALQDRYAGFLDHIQGLRKKKKSRRSKGEVVANRALVYEIQEDSDDIPEDFNSEKFGNGTSKVVAQHYNTTQAKSTKDKSITHKDIANVLELIKKAQEEKRQAKNGYTDFENPKDQMADTFARTKAENAQLITLVKDLENQIAAEIQKLEKVRRLKDQDVQFVENAFFTSNEEGMGVSPSAYTVQNAIPRPATRSKDPAVTDQNQEQLQFEDQILRDVDNIQIQSSYHGVENFVKDKSGNHSGRAETLESGKEQSSLPDIRRISMKPTKKRKANSNARRFGSESGRDTLGQQKSRNQSKKDESSNNKTNKRTAEFGTNKKSLDSRLQSSSNLDGITAPKKTVIRKPGTRSKGDYSPGLSKISEGSMINKRQKTIQSTRSANVGSTSKSQLGVIKEQKANKIKYLKMKPITKERSRMVYMTSEDSQGLPIKKLKKKKKSDSDSMEYYTSLDDQGNRVQKLKRKEKLNTIQERGRKKSKKLKSNSRSRNQEQKYDFTKRIRGSDMSGLEDEQAVSLTNRKKPQDKNAKSADRIQTDTARRVTNQRLNQLAGVTQSTFNDGVSFLRGQNVLHDAGLLQMRMKRHDIPKAPSPDYQVTTLSEERKQKKKKKAPSIPRDYSGVYFNHTNFERAVIATNGKAPYNNQEVEKISKRTLETLPQKERFKNNWVNQILQAQSVTREGQMSPRSQFKGDRSMLSASQTARTVFQGRPETIIDQNNVLFGSINQTGRKKKISPIGRASEESKDGSVVYE